jgi:YVTN family beta-propeller protein
LAGIGLVASLWVGVALGGGNPKAPLAYVTERDSNSVSVIDTATNEVIATIENVGPAVEGDVPGPGGMVITPNGNRGYVANTGVFENGFQIALANTVSVINTKSNNKVVATVEVGYGPLGVAVTPDGKYVYVTNFGNSSPFNPELGDPGNTVSVIRTSNNKVVDTIEIGKVFGGFGPLPAGIAITPNGKRAYVANRGFNTVSVIKIRYLRGKVVNEVITSIPVGDKPANVVITPDGKRAYVTNFSTPATPTPPGTSINSVSVIDTKENEVVATIEDLGTGPLGLAVTPEGDKVYVVNVGDFNPLADPLLRDCTEISVIDTKDDKVTARIPIEYSPKFGGPRAVAITPDGAYAYVTNFGLNTVEVIDTAKVMDNTGELINDTACDSDSIVYSIEVPGIGPNWITISDPRQRRVHHRGHRGYERYDDRDDNRDDWEDDSNFWR